MEDDPRRLVQVGAQQLVATAGDVAGVVRLAGLIAPRRQADVGPDAGRSVVGVNTTARCHRAVVLTTSGCQVEDERNSPEREAELAVVLMVKVPLVMAVVPDAVLLKLKVTLPEPPLT